MRAPMQFRSAMAMLAIFGAAAVTPAQAQSYLHYKCTSGLEFEATLFADTKAAFLQVDGKSLNLPKRMSVTWARYSKDGVTFRVKGQRATLKRGGKTLDCTAQ
jgi:membrane-bound inhibitor of C-type lysozyme